MSYRQVHLSKSEQALLERLSDERSFFASLRDSFHTHGGLTLRQYEALTQEKERLTWQTVAQRIADIPVRNRYCTRDGEPRCAHREQPWCDSAATEIVGSWGYCRTHAPAARGSLALWQRERAAAREASST